ncbi:meiotic recombination protein REC8 homolog [Sebastes fasciatus]|uniref:meiotic recombination protein REC8 homolog n=1 Tax=Sebastes fasciatus TaxID=394691 RepID=UPI003D9E9C49
MFYYPTVLRRHTGCFSTIWLVATKGIKITRRDILKVNVKGTCDDIMKYVLEQVPAPQPGLPKPRFSLYLSSQLQYGVVLVYHRQCALFLDDIQSVVGRMLKQRTSQKIDLDVSTRQGLDFTDALSLMEEAEGALDPLFGVMYMRDCVPSPTTLIQRGQEYLRETSPELPEPTRPTAAAAAAAAAREAGITASPETITMRETEPFAIPVAEFVGEDLVHGDQATIDILMAETDDFLEGDLEMLREDVTPVEQEREVERGGREEDLEGSKELPGSTIELQATTASSEEALLPQEEPELSVEKPGPPSDQLTPVSVPVVPSPPSAAPTLQPEDVPLPEVKKRRGKRQLVFFDPETQIRQEVLQRQINDPLFETSRPLYPPPPSQRMLSAAELFNNPCTSLPEEVLSLWRRAATIKPLSGLDLQVGERGPESTDSEKEREREMVEAAEAAEREEVLNDVPRHVAEPERFEISEHGSLPPDVSDQREASREISPLPTSEIEGSTVSRPVSVLQEIPELLDELPGRAAAESPGLLLDLLEQEGAPVVFQSLLPPAVDRRTVSNSFLRLLENLSDRKVRAEQEVPYGDILILPGPNYGEELLTL